MILRSSNRNEIDFTINLMINLTKKKDKILRRERLVVNLQWIKDLGLYDSYWRKPGSVHWQKRVAESRLLRNDDDYSAPCPNVEQEVFDVSLERSLNFSLQLHHFHRLIRFTFIMYGVATVALAVELFWHGFFRY